jgi:outer membrane protein TolC
MFRLCLSCALCALIAVPPLAARAQGDEEILTLRQAEQLALEQSPWIKHHATSKDAAAERAVYEGSLPDPQLTVGAVNVPTDTWKLNQEDMTMTQVGVRQAFPPGDTLALRSQRATLESAREHARLDVERRALTREVRKIYLDLYFAERALGILQTTHAILARDVKDTEARHRAAQETERAVLRARQNLARLAEREPMLRAEVVRTRTKLARYLGAAANLPLPADLPQLPDVPAAFNADDHPDLLAAQANVEAARAEVDVQRQEYRPGYMLDVMYGFRQQRSDMMTALVSVDLPIFRQKRQDRKLAEKQTMQAAATYEKEDKRREVAALHETARAGFEAAKARAQILSEQLLPAIRRETQGRLAGFAREQTELREARMKELEAELDLLRAHVDGALAQAELLYFTGENPS